MLFIYKGCSFVTISCTSQQHSATETCIEQVQHTSLYRVYLFSCLHFPVAVQEVALDDRAHNGQTLACLQLRCKGEQSRVFYMEVLIQLQQHQQLRSIVHRDSQTKAWIRGVSLHPC